jgi:hypothetical protein
MSNTIGEFIFLFVFLALSLVPREENGSKLVSAGISA